LIFKEKKIIHKVLESLFKTYSERVPDVKKITNGLIKYKVIEKQEDIINDHIAFRTLGVKHLGIQSLEKIFIHHGYEKRDYYNFDKKKLNAYWYSHPEKNMPRIFISELRVNDLSTSTRKIIYKYTSQVKSDPVEKLNLNSHHEIIEFLSSPLWELPSITDYDALLDESEYASWVIYNRYYLNHYTISVHDLPKNYNNLENFNKLLVDKMNIRLNDSGGIIKVSNDGLLLQSSSVANQIMAEFSNNETKLISGSYVEFAERKILPKYLEIDFKNVETKHIRDGFEASNADKIFESTFTTQTLKK